MSLRLDWCSAAAARYACEHWHYSRRVPVFKLVRVGVWEGDKFVGVILFGSGAASEIGSPFGLRQTEICELVRIALREHVAPVSRMVAIALKMLRQQSPGLRLVISFADSAEGHHGGIYQAGGWLYLGSAPYHAYRVKGEIVHPKTLHSRYGRGGQSIPWLRANVDPNAERISTAAKHKYAMPLDDEIRAKLAPLAKPYPKRAGSKDSVASSLQLGEGGASPTPALQLPQDRDGTP